MDCPVGPLDAGVVEVGWLRCADQRFSNGDGTGADGWLANAALRAIVRHPESALTVPGTGGGTLIDVAPWGSPDVFHEIVPRVGGGWLEVDAYAWLADGLTLSGTVRPLPHADASEAGARRSVTWRIRPDDPWLQAEGADGFWILPDRTLDRVGDAWVAGDVVFATDAEAVRDLGGGIEALGGDRLLVATTRTAWAALGATRAVAVAAPGAGTVRALDAEGVEVARLAVVEDRAEGVVPDAAVALQAWAAGHAPGPAGGLDTDALALGAPGGVDLRIGWPDLGARPVSVAWEAADGRRGRARLPPTGGPIATGAGRVTLTLDAGPSMRPRTIAVVAEDPAPSVATGLARALSPGRSILVDLGWPAGRSRTVRGAVLDRARDAAAAGLDWAVFTAEDEVGEFAAYLNDLPWIRATTGTSLTGPAGWTVEAWPWSPASRRAGHGAPAVRALGLGPEEALAAAWGGEGFGRRTRVDLAWLEAVDTPPDAVRPTPDFVRLGPPDPTGADPLAPWSPWLRWLDARRPVVPSGPLAWVEVGTPARWGAAELERAFVRGRFVATTGPWLDLRVDRYGPGAVAEPRDDPPPADVETDALDSADSADSAARDLPGGDTPEPARPWPLSLTLRAGTAPITHGAIVTEGGRVVASLDVSDAEWRWTGEAVLGAWVFAAVWSDDGAHWAATAPTWVRPPATGGPPTETGDTGPTDGPETDG